MKRKTIIKCVLARTLGGPLYYFIRSDNVSDISHEKALQIIADHSKDPSGSALCEHVWSDPEYDLTIIVPVYNVEKYLKKCLDSIVLQKTDYTYQVIVVDDGSTDKSSEILESYCGNKQIDVIHQKNGGISNARNTGLGKVSSKYIMFVDSDDFLYENAVESLMSAAYRMDADIVQGSYFDIDEAGEKMWGGMQYQKCDCVAPNGTLAGMAWGKVYKADLFQGIQFPEGYWYEDTIITAIVTHVARKIATIPDTVYCYRQNPASITKISKGKPKSIDTYWIHRCVLRDRKILGLETDCAFYEHLLRMVALSFQRTEKEPKEVKMSLLILWKELLEQERKDDFIINTKYQKLEKAILESDYGRYCVLCKFCY